MIEQTLIFFFDVAVPCCPPLHLSTSPFASLSILSIYLPIYLSVILLPHLFKCLFIYLSLSVCIPFASLSVCLFIYLYLSVCNSFASLFIHLFIYLSVYVCNHFAPLSVCLFIYSLSTCLII